MGAKNVRAALIVDKVSDRAVRVLAAMALISLDHDSPRHQARTYYAGRGVLAAACGRMPDSSGLRYVDRALTELVAAGLVQRTVRKPGPGRPQVYGLVLPVDNSHPDEDHHATPDSA